MYARTHTYTYNLHEASVNRRAVVTLIGWRRDSRQNWSALHSDARRPTPLSPDNDVRGIDFASSKRDTRRSRSIMTRGRHAYYSHVASRSHHLENFARHAFRISPVGGIKEQIVMRPDRRPDARHLPEIRGRNARDGIIIINNVSPRIPAWPTSFLNISA